MARVLTNENNYYNIADTIRQMKNVNTTYKPREMASALKDIYSNEVEGTLPLSFEANGNNLLDYRIDGANGGVGDRTGNLFDGSWENKFVDTYGNTGYSTNRVLSSYVTVIPNQTYSVKSNMLIRAVHSYNDTTHTQALIDNAAGLDGATFTIPADSNSIRISLKKANDGNFTPDDIDWFMLNIGSQPLPNEPYGYKVPVVVSGKNLLQNTATTQSINGVNVIVNNDGSIKLSGTSTAITYIDINSNFNSTEFQDCYLNPFYPNNFVSSASTVLLRISNTANRNSIQDFLNNSVIRDNGSNLRLAIRIGQNYTFSNNFVISPMISKFSDNTYEPYHEPTTTNIYLDEPIEAKANIPNEYEEVEYIESTGTQYIDTNYTPVQGDDLEFKNVTINTFNGALFSAGTESYQLILLGLGSVCYYKYFQTGNAAASSFSTITNGNIKVLNGNLYINNVLKVEANYGGAVNTTLNIFQRANNTSNLIGKIGEIIISNNGIIKRDFIPCYRKSDNVAGLYDLVNNTFYTNQGTGNFMVGPIKENESISLSDTNTNIPTLDGTNTLSIDTTVQPSNVYIQAPKDSIEATMIANALEEI